MSWIQVYITGLAKSIEPTDEEIEQLLNDRYSLASDDSILWAGQGTTLVKRDEWGSCRGFAFLAFYSAEGASIVVERVNTTCQGDMSWPLLHAELSDPKASKKRSKKKEKDQHLPDFGGARRRRGEPIKKHPVIMSSDGKRTNLGSKTK